MSDKELSVILLSLVWAQRGVLVGGHWKIIVTFPNPLWSPFQYVSPYCPLLLFLDHRRGWHTVHDQLCPCSDGEHTSQTHQDTGLLDCPAYRGWLCYTEVSFFFSSSFDMVQLSESKFWPKLSGNVRDELIQSDRFRPIRAGLIDIKRVWYLGFQICHYISPFMIANERDILERCCRATLKQPLPLRLTLLAYYCWQIKEVLHRSLWNNNLDNIL